MKLKKGVILSGLDIRMRPALIEASKIWESRGEELVITSGLEGNHSAGSYHYYGLAFDCRTNYFEKDVIKIIADELRHSLPSYFDIVIEVDHIHIEHEV